MDIIYTVYQTCSSLPFSTRSVQPVSAVMDNRVSSNNCDVCRDVCVTGVINPSCLPFVNDVHNNMIS